MLQKNSFDISFAKGIDTKTDPKRVSIGNFVSLQNTVFNKGGLLQKRNGYKFLSSLPDNTSSYVTTFNENLTAIGSNITAYNETNATWVQKGNIQPLSIDTLPIIRNNLNQTACDSAVSSGLVCTAYLEYNGTTGLYANKYVIADVVTGQNIVAPTILTTPVSSPLGVRVFVLGSYFIIIFTVSNQLFYLAKSIQNPSNNASPVSITTSYVPKPTLSWDGYVFGNSLYIAYNSTAGGQSVKVVSLSNELVLSPPFVLAGYAASMMSVTADVGNSIIYVSFYDVTAMLGYTASFTPSLSLVMAPLLIASTVTWLNMTSSAQNGYIQVFAEVSNNYSWDSSIPTHYINAKTVTNDAISADVVTIRSVGLASKSFIIDGIIYFLSAYQSPYQPTYFLINGTKSLSSSPVIAAKLAYSNGGGYLPTGLPSVTVTNSNIAQVSYLFKDLIQAVNKDTNVPAGTQTAGIYSQTGINLATLTFGTSNLIAEEIGNDLHLTGGYLLMYDGYLPVEHNFFVWPDTDQANPSDTATWSASGGSVAAKPDGATNTNAYYVQFTYEWTDNQGNAFRSAPSIPIPITTTGSGTSGSITYNVPTLRLTSKVPNPVKIVAYRWSVAQQIYYQTTSIVSPILNDTTVDSVQFVDTNSDATILGNNILYTTGGVVEDVNAPASNAIALFDTRLWLVDAEDKNLLWFSKQVIESTPVEMSDLFTIFVPSNTGVEGTTGPIAAIFPMDDKLIIFKNNAILYINGSGPDNTGANNQYSQPIFITSTVGCSNQKSIVLTPTGLMFQSNKGIWLLDRGLNTTYIGAPVEAFNAGNIVSAQIIPATNQVRFISDLGVTLMYDYYYGEWGTFTNVPGISGCIFQGFHTYIDSNGRVFQESPGYYLDGSNPVLISFTTGPLRLGDLQNYQRAFFFYLLGQYYSPHKLAVSISYDYSPDVSQTTILVPLNFSSDYGAGSSQSPYGQGNPYGGPARLEQFRVFLQQQRCQAFAITVQEFYDGTYSVPAGQGLSLSGINLVMGFKGKFPTLPANISFG